MMVLIRINNSVNKLLLKAITTSACDFNMGPCIMTINIRFAIINQNNSLFTLYSKHNYALLNDCLSSFPFHIMFYEIHLLELLMHFFNETEVEKLSIMYYITIINACIATLYTVHNSVYILLAACSHLV